MSTTDFHELIRRFRRTTAWSDHRPVAFPEIGVDLYHLSYRSANGHFLLGGASYRCLEHGVTFPARQAAEDGSDQTIGENILFRYPLLREHATMNALRRHSRVLILFHGLNERSFAKYLPWACRLRESTGRPVLLFPMTFHINRVLPAWGAGQSRSYAGRAAIAGNENSHRFNAVISERLSAHPERLFWGAEQSYWDVVDLARTIRTGRHSHFAEGTRVDMLGFSAGGYLPFILTLHNPEDLFGDSRVTLFSSGAPLRDLNLSSPLIMDHLAEVALMKLYVRYTDRLASERLRHWLDHHEEGIWINNLCGPRPGGPRLGPRLKEVAPRVLGIANSSDCVVPTGGMMNGLQGIRRDSGVRIEELELGIHENPFTSERYDLKDRSTFLDYLNQGRFGGQFDRFIELVTAHCAA